MRIATWNLDRCPPGASARGSTFLAMMAEVNADVWVLTETYQAFSPGADFRLIAHSAEAPDREAGRGECWVAVWSRLAAELVPLTEDLERVAAAKIGRDVVVVGTVLPWNSDTRDPRLSGKAAFLARLEEQARDWTRLQGSTGGLFVAGDFNQDLLSLGPVGMLCGRLWLPAAWNV